MSVALIYVPDLNESILFNMNEQQLLEVKTDRTSCWMSKFAFVEVCPPVDVRILPKEKVYR